MPLEAARVGEWFPGRHTGSTAPQLWWHGAGASRTPTTLVRTLTVAELSEAEVALLAGEGEAFLEYSHRL